MIVINKKLRVAKHETENKSTTNKQFNKLTKIKNHE